MTNAIYLCGRGEGERGALHIWKNQGVNGPITLLTDSKISFQNWCAIRGSITAAGTGKNLELFQPNGYEPRYCLEIYSGISLGAGVLTINSLPANGGSELGYNVDLRAANVYSGGTVLTNYAKLMLSHAGALGSGGITLCPNTRLNLNGNSVTIPWLRGADCAITDKNGAVGTTTLTVNQSADTVYSGVISNGATRAIALVKNGPGTLALSGTNAYTGATTVNGTLCVNGSLGTASLTVYPGSAFAAGATGVVGRASLAGTMTFQDNSRLLVDVRSSEADTVTVSGNVVIGSNVELRVSDDQTSSGSWKVVDSVNGTVTGDFVLVGGVNKAVLEKTANAVWLKIPPKGTLILLL